MPRNYKTFKIFLSGTVLSGFCAMAPLTLAQDVEAASLETPSATAIDTEAVDAAPVKPASTSDVSTAEASTGDAPEIEASAEESPEANTLSASVDYSMMTTLMEKLSVNERGRPALAYKLMRDKALPALDEYEALLTAVNLDDLTGDDRLAYWLNLQNFLVVKAITTDTKKTNLKSLRGSGKKPGKLWTKERVTLGGKSYSIAAVEAQVTSEFNDPNIIYGLYQGVKGGPCINETAYEGETVRARLAELGARYVNSRGIVSPSKGVVTLTPVYDWYKSSLFNDDDQAILKHVKSHANTALRGRLNTGRSLKYTKLNYTADNYVVPKGTSAPTPRRRQAPSAPRPPQQQRPRGGGFGS